MTAHFSCVCGAATVSRVLRLLLSLVVGLTMNSASSAAEPASSTGVIQRVRLSEGTEVPTAVVVNGERLVHTAQLFPSNAEGKLVGGGDVAAQTEQLVANLTTTLAAAGSALPYVAKLNVYVASDELTPTVNKVLLRAFGANAPAVCYVTTRLPQPEALVALDAVATRLADSTSQIVTTARVPGVSGAPRNTHVATLPPGGRIYVAGQAEKGDIREATRKTLESLRATLKFLGRTDRDIVQLKSFVTPMDRIAEFEDEFRKFFADEPIPPLVFVEWQSTLPIEIELIASAGPEDAKSPPSDPVEFLTPPGMTTPTIYSRVTRIHGPQTIYVGGLYGPAGANGTTQVTDIFGQLEKALAATRSDLRHLSKATYYVVDDDASQKLNELRPKYYDPKRPPAASKAVVRGVASPSRTITVDMIAVPQR